MNVEDCPAGSALARFEPGMGLVDDVDRSWLGPSALQDLLVAVRQQYRERLPLDAQ